MAITSLFWGRSQANSHGLSGLLAAASSKILSLRSNTSTQWKSSHLPKVHASICFNSSSNSAWEHERNLFISAWHFAGWKFIHGCNRYSTYSSTFFIRNIYLKIYVIKILLTASDVYFLNLFRSIFILADKRFL